MVTEAGKAGSLQIHSGPSSLCSPEPNCCKTARDTQNQEAGHMAGIKQALKEHHLLRHNGAYAVRMKAGRQGDKILRSFSVHALIPARATPMQMEGADQHGTGGIF